MDIALGDLLARFGLGRGHRLGDLQFRDGADVLDEDLDDRLDQAVAPARSAGLQVAYGGGAGQIGQVTHDLKSEIIGLACALVLLLFMFGSLIAAAIPLLSAIFSVGAGLSLLGSTVWVTFLAILGYEVGANYTRVSGPIGTAAIVIGVLVVIVVVVWYLRGRGRDAPSRAGG